MCLFIWDGSSLDIIRSKHFVIHGLDLLMESHLIIWSFLESNRISINILKRCSPRKCAKWQLNNIPVTVYLLFMSPDVESIKDTELWSSVDSLCGQDDLHVLHEQRQLPHSVFSQQLEVAAVPVEKRQQKEYLTFSILKMFVLHSFSEYWIFYHSQIWSLHIVFKNTLNDELVQVQCTLMNPLILKWKTHSTMGYLLIKRQQKYWDLRQIH